MEYRRYIARRRARIDSISGQIKIPYGTVLINRDGFLVWKNKQICAITSRNAHNFFCQNDDGKGKERGDLLNAILPKLEKRDAKYQARWNKLWKDSLCQRYRRLEHEDHWIWNHDFYNAPVEDLRYIAKLIDVQGWEAVQ